MLIILNCDVAELKCHITEKSNNDVEMLDSKFQNVLQLYDSVSYRKTG